MACLRCEMQPIAHRERWNPQPIDPPFPIVRTMGAMGPRIEPPPGFDPARICSMCGVVYYPITGEPMRAG